MSRNTRWKLETIKVKVVFRLQFHATHIPQTGWNNLFISFIPSESEKASAKTNKANVRNGTCKWADPIYETTRLLQDSKTKQYEQKIYKLVVAMGTSRSSLLGEATINLSDYVDASKPVVVTLPLHGSDSAAILHVTVQLLTSKTGFREFEQQREVSDRGLPANTDHVGAKLSSPGEAVVSRSDKVNQRVRFKPENKELASLEEESGFSEGYADSAAGFDVSSNASGSLYAEKPDNSSSREVDSIKSTTFGDLGGVSTSPSTTMVPGTNDWIHQWSDENSVERDMTIVYEENTRLKRALEVADLSIHELRQEVVSLQNFADGLSVETRNMTEKIAIEISSEQNLAKEVAMLKLECLRFKHDLEQVRNLKMNPPGKDLRQATENSFYLLGEISTGKEGTAISEISSNKTDNAMSDTGLGVELCHPEGVLLPGLLTSGTISMDASNEMQVEIFRLLRELDESKSEQDNLVQKMGQMECYYEALIQELEVNQKQIIGELQNLRHEHGSCIYTVSSTTAQMEAMHQQMNNELLRFAEEKCSLDALNNELERRAAISEAALKRARLNYSIAVNQLQKDLEVLSKQVVSMYETNENLIRNAFSENSLPFLQSCEEAEIDKEYLSLDVALKDHHVGPDRSLINSKSPLILQEDLCRRMQEELAELHLENLNLDIFSVTLYHVLLESDLNNRKEMHDLSEQLKLSFRSNESLRLKLQNISDEIYSLNKEKSIVVCRSNDLALENQTLEAKVRSVSDENHILGGRVEVLESLVNEYRDYKSKYEICDDEKARLENQLEQSDAEKHLLSHDVYLLKEEVMTMKIKVAENDKLQKMVNYMQENLENLLAIGEKQISDFLPCSNEDKNPDCDEFMSIIMQIENRLLNFQNKIFQLTEEKTNLVNERDAARASSASAEVEVKAVMQGFENDLLDVKSKLNASSALVEKLQVDFEAVTNKLLGSSEEDEKCSQMTRDLLSDFTRMENALQELTLENRNLADMIVAFGSVTDELEHKKLTVKELKGENLSLTRSLECKIDENHMLTKELDKLKGTVESLQEEITRLRGTRDRLDVQILNLNNQMKERDEKFGQLDQQEVEINPLQLLDIKSEKSSIKDQLSYADAQGRNASEEISSTNLELQLLETHGLLITSDVVQTILEKQYKLHVEELISQLEYYHRILEEADEKNLDLASKLSNLTASNENYAAENATLLSDLDSIKSELEYNVALNQALEHSKNSMAMELSECKEKCGILEVRCADDKSNKFEIVELNCLLRSCQNEIEDLIFSKEELEIRLLVLQATIDEMKAELISRGECKEELEMLRKKCSELSRKLSEQILRTDELKNLSNHLKELKDKAEAEHLQTREKRDAESSSFASQDSLRIAFIREQYETKLQEIRHQLSISKKHGDEMLWKLQDALEELENRKQCEFSQLKTNEELLLRVTELEAELQLVLSDNREKVMENEQLKAELECSVMSLDCCKEEKNQVMITLQECNDYKCKLADDVELLKEQLECVKASMRIEDNSVLSTPCSRGRALEDGDMSNSSGEQANHLAYSMNLNLEKEGGEETNQQLTQQTRKTEVSEELVDRINSENDVEHNRALFDCQLKPQTLLSSIERLQKELEKMRKENTLPPEDENPEELVGEVLQRDQGHLEKVSRELDNMSSLYNDSSRHGNSVERVLALELELADALQAKKKSSSQFQSSFSKLHRDEAAIFQSFRDINELIKDMLEMKERHAAMETELGDMHERYSQLSLDFAEVEGERQRLSMILKNVRPSKRVLCRSPTSSYEDLSS